MNSHGRLLLETDQSMAPIDGNQSDNSYVNNSNFDTNMIIILAALLCALLSVLALNSIVRCAFRCSRSAEGSQVVAAKGIKKKTLRQIPVVVYGRVNFSATECPICLGEFVDGEKSINPPRGNREVAVSGQSGDPVADRQGSEATVGS
ncbi:hypothetical protein K7X08_000138 [Anisodus acutangulus]|uniref:RING-type E3 ubiquitin transferase n=1 Tax=Anisodus acutangulus TaxID=402998 RepID=A0A9Q1M6E5_9SOLA|nr:hypothetical protein K7X08_000138 [Anisodus acutangulus]